MADAGVLIAKTPFFHERPAFFGFKDFLRAVDPARAEPDGACGQLEITEHERAVLHIGRDCRIGEHDEHRRRAIKGVRVGITEHGGVHALELRHGLGVLHDDDFGGLPPHTAGRPGPGLYDGVELLFCDLPGFIAAAASAGGDGLQYFVCHN